MSLLIVPSSEAWPPAFEAVRGELLAALDGVAVQVEHIGSTSVPGLCAKPVIDVLLGAASLAVYEATAPALAQRGFERVVKYDALLPMRRYFVRPAGDVPRVHVHAVVVGSDFWREHLAFRDRLRADAALRDAYAALKLDLARIHAHDKAAYTEAKAPFIRQVLASESAPHIGDHRAMAHTTAADTTPAVDAFIAGLEHPAKALVVQLRAAVLAADPAIAEGVKWNAPSFRTGEYFATMNLRAKVGVALVLHFGAKVRSVAAGPESIDDPGQLLKWLAKDRALVAFGSEVELQARQMALQTLLRQWIRHV